MNLLLFEPYYSRKGHFGPYTNRVKSFFENKGVQTTALIGINESAEAFDSSYIPYRFKDKGRVLGILSGLKGYIYLFRQAKKKKFEVIHILDYEILLLWLSFLFVSKNITSRLFITVHSVNFLTKSSLLFRPYIFLAKKAYQSFAKRHSRFFCNGKHIQDFLVNSFELPSEQVHTTGWGMTDADPSTVKKVPNSILLLGILRKDKNIEYALEQLKRVKSPFTLTIAGYPEDYSEQDIVDLIESLQLQQCTELNLRYLSDAEMSLYLAKSEFVLISYSKENQSNSGPLMDGLAYNCIPIVSLYGQRAHIINELNCVEGFRFEDENALSQLIQSLCALSESQKNDLRTCIKQKSVPYSWNSILHKYFEAYLNPKV